MAALIQKNIKHSDHAGQKLKIVFFITFFYMFAEFIGGYFANSLALVADASHMLSDSTALLLSIIASWLVSRPADSTKTFGYLRAEIIAAFINSISLIFIALFIIYEAFLRIIAPPEVNAPLMILIACGGLAVNISGLFILREPSEKNINVQAAFLHIIGDFLGSLGAIIAGILIIVWKFYLADPLISFFIAGLILYSASKLIYKVVHVLLQAAPLHINVKAIKAGILEISGVEDVYDLHVWTVSTDKHVLSVHVIVNCKEYDKILGEIVDLLRNKYNITHSTVQIEPVGFCDGRCEFEE